MSLRSITLTNFRSYHERKFDFKASVNIIVGPNGSGKTNLLESIYVLSTSKSFRVSDDELIEKNQPWYRIEGKSSQGEVVVTYDALKPKPQRKKLKIDKKNVTITELIGYNPTSLFEPTHLQLIHGSPELRRRFLDGVLSQLDSEYLKTLQRYRKALKHRNALLRQHNPLTDQLFVWNVQISQFGAIIDQKRRALIDEYNQDIQKLYSEFSDDKVEISLRYISSISAQDYASKMMDELERRLPRDLALGSTSVGPHRADFAVSYDKSTLESRGSRGEVRTVILVLKLLELRQIEKLSKYKPILLLDDVFSELDSARRQAVVDHLKKYQVFITTTDADAVLKYFPKHVNTIELTV